MSYADRIRRRFGRLLQSAARDQAATRSINVVHGSNVVVARSIGERGSTQRASSSQVIRARQRDGETTTQVVIDDPHDSEEGTT